MRTSSINIGRSVGEGGVADGLPVCVEPPTTHVFQQRHRSAVGGGSGPGSHMAGVLPNPAHAGDLGLRVIGRQLGGVERDDDAAEWPLARTEANARPETRHGLRPWVWAKAVGETGRAASGGGPAAAATDAASARAMSGSCYRSCYQVQPELAGPRLIHPSGGGSGAPDSGLCCSP